MKNIKEITLKCMYDDINSFITNWMKSSNLINILDLNELSIKSLNDKFKIFYNDNSVDYFVYLGYKYMKNKKHNVFLSMEKSQNNDKDLFLLFNIITVSEANGVFLNKNRNFVSTNYYSLKENVYTLCDDLNFIQLVHNKQVI